MLKQKQKNKGIYRAGRNLANKKEKSEKLWKIAANLTIVFSIIFIFAFVISINSLSISGFVLDALKNKQKNLAAETESAELKVLALESYENISQRAGILKMVKADKIDYVIITSGEVAKK